MSERHDETQLLALVEGELDASAAAALRERLSGDPKLKATVEGMIADRLALRSLPEPEMPADFMPQIEPMLTRPMLIEPVRSESSVAAAKPGAYRREYKRQHRRIRWGRLAAVAAIMISLIGGIWAAVNGLVLSGNGSIGGATAKNDGSSAAGSHGGDKVAPAPRLPDLTAADGTIHHYRPSPLPAEAERLAANARTRPDAAAAPANDRDLKDGGPARVAEFAIVIRASDAAAAEASLGRTVASVTPQTALVRNFSFAEAHQLALAWAKEHPRGPGDQRNDPMVADVGGLSPKILANHVRDAIGASPKSSLPSAPDADASSKLNSGLISGRKEFSPTLEQQLDYSARGAALTVAVPASRLGEFLERLNVEARLSTSLRMLPSIDWSKVSFADGGAATKPAAALEDGAASWISDSPRVRQAITLIEQSGDDAMVLVPVVVMNAAKSGR